MSELNDKSWLHLASQDERYTLSAAGLPAAVDCGWVEQMLPFIAAYSRHGDRVLDPFCGWGTTLLAAGLSGRRGVGVDIEAARVDVARRRLAFYGMAESSAVLSGDSAAMPFADASMALCLTSIPYFGPWQDQDWQRTASHVAQCYRHDDYAAYLTKLDQIFGEISRVLKPGAYFVPMVENLRIDGQFVPLAWDCGRLLAQHFIMGDERILSYDKAADDVAGLISNRAHEYALVCRKPL